jgi:hypothetical protein
MLKKVNKDKLQNDIIELSKIGDFSVNDYAVMARITNKNARSRLASWMKKGIVVKVTDGHKLATCNTSDARFNFIRSYEKAMYRVVIIN